MTHDFLIVVAGVVAGAIASVSGFGIGSILTPLLANFVGMKLAVAVVSVPHFLGTALRLTLIREHIDKKVLVTFGITSAIGGLAGALLHVWLRSVALSYVLGALAGVRGGDGNYKDWGAHAFRQDQRMDCGRAVWDFRRAGWESGRDSLGGAAGI